MTGARRRRGRRPAVLGGWALVGCVMACTDQGATPIQSNVAADSADQILERMTTTITREGVVTTRVYADTTFMYSDRQVASMRQVRAAFVDAQGNQTAILTSKRAEYLFGRGTLEAWDSVDVQSVDGTNRRLRTNHLIYDRDQNQIRSDSAFTYTSPTEVLRGTSFISDPSFKNVVARQPRGHQRGQGTAIPGPSR